MVLCSYRLYSGTIYNIWLAVIHDGVIDAENSRYIFVKHIRDNVTIPVIASSGAGKVEHFSEVFEKTDVEAALAASIFHREEVPIEAVKEHMRDEGIETR
jgi:glutamine amidotransferase/cyclase